MLNHFITKGVGRICLQTAHFGKTSSKDMHVLRMTFQVQILKAYKVIYPMEASQIKKNNACAQDRPWNTGKIVRWRQFWPKNEGQIKVI